MTLPVASDVDVNAATVVVPADNGPVVLMRPDPASTDAAVNGPPAVIYEAAVSVLQRMSPVVSMGPAPALMDVNEAALPVTLPLAVSFPQLMSPELMGPTLRDVSDVCPAVKVPVVLMGCVPSAPPAGSPFGPWRPCGPVGP